MARYGSLSGNVSAPAPNEEPSFHQPETGSLARAAGAGDAARFGELYARLAPALFAWAELRLRPSTRRAVSPEDLAQEVWLRAAAILPAYDPAKSAFRPWLFAVAKNVLLEVQRKLARTWKDRSTEGETGRLFALDQVPEEVTSLSRRLARDDSLARFLARAGTLDEEDRLLLVHCGLEALPVGDVAARLDIGKEAAAKRWQRLRERVREWPSAQALLADDGR